MHILLKKKLLIIILITTFIVTTFSVQQTLAYDPTIGWTSQATGCTPQSGNINAPLNDVYLGVGSTVPQSILSQDPNANAGYLEAWKADMIGLVVNQFKSFIIPAAQAYPSGNLAGKDLFFEITIKSIVVGGSVTTSNSVVDVIYSLYTDCQVASTIPSTTSENSVPSTTTTDTSTTHPAPPNYTGIIVGGGLVGVVIFSVVGYIIYSGRKTNLNTDKIIDKTRTKQSQTIQSLKASLDTQPISKSNSPVKKAPPSRRRR